MYYNFDLERSVPNFAIPRKGRTVRITDPHGQQIKLGRKRIRSGKYRIQYQKVSYEEQLEEAFRLFDRSLQLLEKVDFNIICKIIFNQYWHVKRHGGVHPRYPDYPIKFRCRTEFQGGNFSRFVPVWLLILGNPVST